MKKLNRRSFVASSVLGSALAMLARQAQAELKKVEEDEPKAVAVGYRHDTNKVDGARYPKHKPEQHCQVCLAFYPSDDEAEQWGECDLMSDRLVHKNGWCSSYKPIKG